MDEPRLGLKPVLRRVWAPRGSHPVAPVRPRYKWLYVWAFVRPATGETFWLLLPTVSVAACTLARREVARAVGAGRERRVALVWDGAGWHTSRPVRIPAGVHPIRLPAYSPELQPAERLGPLVDEAVANRTIADPDELEDRPAERCRWLDARPEAVRPLTAFRWWPDQGPPYRKPSAGFRMRRRLPAQLDASRGCQHVERVRASARPARGGGFAMAAPARLPCRPYRHAAAAC